MTADQAATPARRRAARVTTRAEQQGVREYAEALLQALRRWDTRRIELPWVSCGSPRAARFQLVGVGRPSSIGTIGGGGSVEYLEMPGPRPYTVREIITTIDRLAVSPAHSHLAEHLKRIRDGRGPATLLRAGGWAAPTPWAQTYALALFTLAIQLGDPLADAHLAALRRASPLL